MKEYGMENTCVAWSEVVLEVQEFESSTFHDIFDKGLVCEYLEDVFSWSARLHRTQAYVPGL